MQPFTCVDGDDGPCPLRRHWRGEMVTISRVEITRQILRETDHRVDAPFRGRGVAWVHRHVGAAPLARIAETGAVC
jgi:hypothetical protein